MTLNIKITDEKQLEQIERLRGKIPAKDFVARLVGAGLRVAVAELKQMKEGQKMRFSPAKPEFKTLDVSAITEALKDKDAQNPVKLEVGRLVRDYTEQLSQHAKRNGNKLPASLRVQAGNAIEKVAFQITVEAIKHAVAKGKESASAKKSAKAS